MVASPNLSLTVTPPGGSGSEYKTWLAYSGHAQKMTISQNFGRQGDTAVLPLVDEHAAGAKSFYIPAMSQVKLYDGNCSKTLFAGVATAPIIVDDGLVRTEWTLDCKDYTLYADSAIVHGVWYGWTTDDIVIDLVQQADCGITAAKVRDGGYVAPGPMLPSFVLNYKTLADAWRRLAVLAGVRTPYGWYVDENRQLHFYDATTAISSGVTFTTTPTTGGSTTEGHIRLDSQNAYKIDGTQVRNKILVQGATQKITTVTTGNPTDTWTADGSRTSWPLRYTVTGSPTLLVGGVATSVTVVTGGGSASGAWVVEQNSTGQWFLLAEDPPSYGTVIEIWYDYKVPVVAQVSDYASQQAYTGPNGGVYAMFVSDSSLYDMTMAYNRAQQQRQEYSAAAEVYTFNTTEDFLGYVRAGETCVVDNSLLPDPRRSGALGINDTFLVTANRVTFGKGGYRRSTVTAVRL